MMVKERAEKLNGYKIEIKPEEKTSARGKSPKAPASK